jgi:hypothetical protein
VRPTTAGATAPAHYARTRSTRAAERDRLRRRRGRPCRSPALARCAGAAVAERYRPRVPCRSCSEATTRSPCPPCACWPSVTERTDTPGCISTLTPTPRPPSTASACPMGPPFGWPWRRECCARRRSSRWACAERGRNPRGLAAVMDQAVDAVAATAPRAYMTVDIDVLDPAFAPGTGTPEPGGLTTRELLWTARQAARMVCPPFDHAGITALACRAGGARDPGRHGGAAARGPGRSVAGRRRLPGVA